MPQAWFSLCVSRCIANAGILTYALPQVTHFLADCESRLRCVCLCRDKFDDVAYCLPHSEHVYLGLWSVATAWAVIVAATPATPGEVANVVLSTDTLFFFDRPSLTKNASYVYAMVFVCVGLVGMTVLMDAVGAPDPEWGDCCWCWECCVVDTAVVVGDALLCSDWLGAGAGGEALRSRIAWAAVRSSGGLQRTDGRSSNEYGL